ncbi:hypothetical protein QQF64_028802 [Cirrhinus molitorella]|uniref:Uncharacterized protein n=1 Tax=Cirrhinus molitorella TaxID=172907 RepID=A0ABR3N7P4_9TELE
MAVWISLLQTRMSPHRLQSSGLLYGSNALQEKEGNGFFRSGNTGIACCKLRETDGVGENWQRGQDRTRIVNIHPSFADRLSEGFAVTFSNDWQLAPGKAAQVQEQITPLYYSQNRKCPIPHYKQRKTVALMGLEVGRPKVFEMMAGCVARKPAPPSNHASGQTTAVKIIDDLAQLVDKTDGRIKNETHRVKLLDTKSASCGMMVVIVLLLIAIIVVAVWQT